MPKPIRGKRFVTLAGLVVLAVLVLGVWLGWDHLRFLWLFEPLGTNEQGYPEYRHRQTGIVMVKVPGGTFMMGCAPRADGIHCPREEPQHRVALSPYLIAKYELTVEQWNTVMEDYPRASTGQNLPAGDMSWTASSEFCRRAGLSLPTEAQWEFACRAGDEEWVFKGRPGFQGRVAEVGDGKGGRIDGLTVEWFDDVAEQLDGVAWFNENSGGAPHPVGEKEPNGFGLHDMIGNVEELCRDTYSESFYGTSEALGLNPECTLPTEQTVRRGACYLTPNLGHFRSTFRLSSPREMDVPFVGFRPAYYPLP